MQPRETVVEVVRISEHDFYRKVNVLMDLSSMIITPLPSRQEAVGAAIVEAAFRVHRALGPGLLEKFYEACLCYELEEMGFKVARQVCLQLRYKDVILKDGLRLDLLVEDSVVVECKSVEQMIPLWQSQILTQLKITGHRLGYLINFNVPLLKDGIKRIILQT
jgi:GxxExxY protein